MSIAATYAVTWEKSGKKLMMVTKTSNRNPTALTSTPKRPSDHLAGGRGSPNSRLQSTQPMLKAYVAPIAPEMRPPIELKASPVIMRVTTDCEDGCIRSLPPPRLIKDKTTAIINVAIMALRGRCVPRTTLTF